MADQYVPVGTSATVIHQLAGGETLKIHNPHIEGVTVYISNNSGVTTTTGFPMGAGSDIIWRNGPGTIYGITAAGASTLRLEASVSSTSVSPVY